MTTARGGSAAYEPTREVATMPNPGPELMGRVAGTTDRDWFVNSGRQSVQELDRTLSTVGRSLASFESILDFGCGCGRVLLWLEDLARESAVYGSDIDPEAIAWAAENIPYAQVSVNPHDPPLPYDDHTFDLVFSHSVFTHMDEERQDWWLRELRRVTRVGGFLLLSVSGENAVRFLRESLEEDAEKRLQLADDITAHLERDGIYFIPDINDPLNRGLPSWYQATFHAPWYVFEHWGRWFEIRSFIPGAALGLQDHVLLERVPDDDGRRLGLRARPVAHAMPGLKPRALDVARAAHTTEHGPSRFGRAGALARRVVLRTLRPYTAHEQKLDEHLAATIDELARVTNDHAARIAALERRSDGSP